MDNYILIVIGNSNDVILFSLCFMQLETFVGHRVGYDPYYYYYRIIFHFQTKYLFLKKIWTYFYFTFIAVCFLT